jgi:exopolyphosphatase/guanosine-5'-triphosphate,3'-diphosphate pyrophosphatase
MPETKDITETMANNTAGTAETYAAIDLGSNSFHMIVCRFSDGTLHIEDRLRERVRLSGGLDEKRQLSEDAKQRALECLTRFGQRISGIPKTRVRAVGTNTLRSAHNAGKFLAKAKKALGHPIEVISGVEEARLIYLGVAHGIGPAEERRLVMDIGGGSTELIIGEGFNPIYMQSLYMGCVSMTQRFFADGAITTKAMKQAEIAARVELEPVAAIYRNMGWDLAIGASGTIRAVRTVVGEAGWCAEGITLDALKKLRDALLDAGHMDKLDFKGMSEERKPVLAGGAIVLLAIFKALGIEQLKVSDRALREGLIYDLLGRFHQDDVRGRAVANLAQRYHVDTIQAERVANTAMDCLTQVADTWQLDVEDAKQWLGWAAQLHEIGLDIAHSQYHKHGAYIVEHADLAGFSRQEQLLLSTLIRLHRRKFSSTAIQRLMEEQTSRAHHLAILFRLAVLLNRSRLTKPLPEFDLKAEDEHLDIRFPDDWLKKHRLTQADLEQEQNFLKAAGFKLSFS